MNIQDLLKPYDQLVAEQVSAVQANSNDILQVTPGSTLLALIESNSDVTVWLQSIAVYLYAFSRFSTCVSYQTGVRNPDLDSALAQFNFPRLTADYATTAVVFSRIDASQPAFIPVIPAPTQVTTSVGNIVFLVQVDTNNIYWNQTLGGYLLPIATENLAVPVRAVIAGTSGNVGANQINQIVSGIPYIQAVTNPSAVTDGTDGEEDVAYLKRFQLYINSLSKATPGAINAAIEGVQDGILFNVLENINYALAMQDGFFTVVIDDGSGNPPDSLVTSVNNAIAVTRALAIQWGVYKTVPLVIPISVTLVLDPTYNAAAIETAVQTALTAYVNGLNVGATLQYYTVPGIIESVSQGIINIRNLELNSTQADIVPTPVESIKVGTISITVVNP